MLPFNKKSVQRRIDGILSGDREGQLNVRHVHRCFFYPQAKQPTAMIDSATMSRSDKRFNYFTANCF
jgi:hypothetical protein